MERQLKTVSVKRLTTEDDLKAAQEEMTKRKRLEDILNHYVKSLDEAFHIGARDMTERELWEKYFSTNPAIPEIERVLNICVDYAGKVEELISDFLVT